MAKATNKHYVSDLEDKLVRLEKTVQDQKVQISKLQSKVHDLSPPNNWIVSFRAANVPGLLTFEDVQAAAERILDNAAECGDHDMFHDVTNVVVRDEQGVE